MGELDQARALRSSMKKEENDRQKVFESAELQVKAKEL